MSYKTRVLVTKNHIVSSKNDIYDMEKICSQCTNIISTILSNPVHNVENFIIWYLLQCKKYANMTMPNCLAGDLPAVSLTKTI